MSNENITLVIYRSNEDGQKPHRYEVPYDHRHSVLTVLNYIYENQDPTLGFRHYKCGRGICNSCRMNINGQLRKACSTVVPPGAHLILKPSNQTVISDLATVIGGGPFRDPLADAGLGQATGDRLPPEQLSDSVASE